MLRQIESSWIKERKIWKAAGEGGFREILLAVRDRHKDQFMDLPTQNLRRALWNLYRTNNLNKSIHYYTMLISMPQLVAEGKFELGPIWWDKMIIAWGDYYVRIEAAQKVVDDKHPDQHDLPPHRASKKQQATYIPIIHTQLHQTVRRRGHGRDLHREIKLIKPKLQQARSAGYGRDRNQQQSHMRPIKKLLPSVHLQKFISRGVTKHLRPLRSESKGLLHRDAWIRSVVGNDSR